MYIIERFHNLRGKEIKDINFDTCQWMGDCFHITTTDGGILSIAVDDEEDGSLYFSPVSKIDIANGLKINYNLYSGLYKRLGFTEEEIEAFCADFIAEVKAREAERQARIEKVREEQEYKQYLKLKEKYEGKDNEN